MTFFEKLTGAPFCEWCHNTHELRPRERSWDSAPLLRDDGTQSYECRECREASEQYRARLYRSDMRRVDAIVYNADGTIETDYERR